MIFYFYYPITPLCNSITGVLDREETIKRLKVETLYDLYLEEKQTGKLELPEY